MSHMDRREHRRDVLQASHDFNRLVYPPVQIVTPHFHVNHPIHRESPFEDFLPVNTKFKRIISSVATDTHPEVNPDTTGHEQAQALVTLWQATDTFEEFVGYLLEQIGYAEADLVNVARAFESSIEEGIDAWDALEPDLTAWGL